MKPRIGNPLARLRAIRFNRTWAILGIALTIGTLAALGARGYLNTQMAAIEAQGKGHTVMAIVAKVDVAKGVRLSPDNMALRAIPAQYAQSTAVTPDDFERIDGQTLAYPVKSGEMIMWGLMETQRAPTFSARVTAGRRAMTVPVDEINSISGMLEPGDLIDLMVTIDQQGKKVTFPLMQAVHVMATGQRSQDDPKGGEQRRFSTVTIDATAEQAQYLIAARDSGKLTALLRNPADQLPLTSRTYDVAGLLGLNGARSATLTGRKPVTVLYGGGSLNTMRPEELRLDRGERADPGVTKAGNAAEAPIPANPAHRAGDLPQALAARAP